MSWLARTFFLVVAAIALTGLISGVACTRRGKSSPIPPTASPLTTISVNPKTGSDSTGNGTTDKPYRTLTKAVAVVKSSTTPGLTIALAQGTYDAANGEIFPIVIPTGMTIAGSGYAGGRFRNTGTFINGAGEDVAFEKLVGAPPSTAFTTLEVGEEVSGVSVSGVYVGSSRLALPGNGLYAAVDALGSLSATRSSFAAGTALTHPNVSGVILPSGTLSCTACTIVGSDRALLAFTVPNGVGPSIVLAGQPTQSIIGGRIGIATDGSASVDAAYQTFQSKEYGYQDSIVPIASPIPVAAAVDFGQGPTQSAGGNVFIGAQSVRSEISVTVAQTTVSALGNVWNPLTQGTDAHGQYPKVRTFHPGDTGRNVSIAPRAAGATVRVGPISTTPQPSPTPTGSPGPTASPT